MSTYIGYLISNKTCSCGEEHKGVPTNAKYDLELDGIPGYTWPCQCGSHQYARPFDLIPMDYRIERFRQYAQHSMLGKVYKRLNVLELSMAEAFLIKHQELSRNEFIPAVQRMFLDDPAKPKHYTEIMELLTCAASAIAPRSA